MLGWGWVIVEEVVLFERGGGMGVAMNVGLRVRLGRVGRVGSVRRVSFRGWVAVAGAAVVRGSV